MADKATLYISSSKPEQLKIRIIDNLGREVKQQSHKLSAGNTTVSIDVTHLSKGLYYLEVKGTTISKRFNFIKPSFNFTREDKAVQ